MIYNIYVYNYKKGEKRYMKKSKISLVLMIMLVVVTVSNTVLAVTGSIVDTNQKGSITIKALSQKNGVTDETSPLEGVEYSLYKVDEVSGEAVTTKEQAEEYIKEVSPVETLTTNVEGTVVFDELELGRYYAKVTDVPTGISEVPESFLVDVPMTNEEGNGWIYDIEVFPKVKVASGEAVVTKTDGVNPMQGVEFKVQISLDDGAWTDYVVDGEVLTLTTNQEGKIALENLPISYEGKDAKFRVIETVVGDEYIMDNKYPSEIEVQPDGTVVVTDTRTNTSAPAAEVGQITIVNEKPEVVKQVLNQEGEYADLTSVNLTDTVTFKITVDVPTVIEDLETFTLTDELPEGLSNVENLQVKALVGDQNTEKALVEDTDYTKTGNFVLDFDTSKMNDYTTLVITYNAKLDMTSATIGEAGNINTATLEYTNKVDTDGTENDTNTTTDTSKVVTGGLKIKKVNSEAQLLDGAKFKIATTRQNALDGIFVKGTDGQDIEVTTVNGYAQINGLEYNDDETSREYWLVETQAPTYQENGETKSYTLLSEPKAVNVGGTSHTLDIEVENKKPISLPLTGGIGTVLFAVVGVGLLVIAKSIKKEDVKD